MAVWLADRRRFLATMAAGAAVLMVPPSLRAETRPRLPRQKGKHPTPRPGYTADKMLTADQMQGHKDLIPLFDGVREIPRVVDGIRCHCGCADQPEKYSLLSCYEGKDAMALWCPICEGQGRLIVRLNREGKTLDEIREAIDARF